MKQDQFTHTLQEGLVNAHSLAIEKHHTTLELDHLFLALLNTHQSPFIALLKECGVDSNEIQKYNIREVKRSRLSYGYSHH